MAVAKSAKKQTSVLAIVAFVLSLTFFIPFSSLAAIIIGIIALVKMSKDPNMGGKGLAIAAIVIGAIMGIVMTITFFGLVFAFTHRMSAIA